MKRVIVTQAGLSGQPLTDLKEWLSISTNRDDSLLEDLLRAALEVCEGFTGLMPLNQICDEVLTASRGPICPATKPVFSLVQLQNITPTGAQRTVAMSDYDFDIDADGRLRIELRTTLEYERLLVRLSAGLASNWNALDPAIRQGIVRLAGYYYRERDDGPQSGSPPASVAALWRPFRTMRLA